MHNGVKQYRIHSVALARIQDEAINLGITGGKPVQNLAAATRRDKAGLRVCKRGKPNFVAVLRRHQLGQWSALESTWPCYFRRNLNAHTVLGVEIVELVGILGQARNRGHQNEKCCPETFCHRKFPFKNY